jgi:hypothetical protein
VGPHPVQVNDISATTKIMQIEELEIKALFIAHTSRNKVFLNLQYIVMSLSSGTTQSPQNHTVAQWNMQVVSE